MGKKIGDWVYSREKQYFGNDKIKHATNPGFREGYKQKRTRLSFRKRVAKWLRIVGELLMEQQ